MSQNTGKYSLVMCMALAHITAVLPPLKSQPSLGHSVTFY